MDRNLNLVKTEVYDKCKFSISEIAYESESKEYDACTFRLNELHVICRTAKITPKKVGQFVTFWKRDKNGPIEPFTVDDRLDFFVVNVRTQNNFGQFVFPKSVLVSKGIVSTELKDGKRAFRVYPGWDIATSNQAVKTQNWQQDYFYEINSSTDLKKVTNLYNSPE